MNVRCLTLAIVVGFLVLAGGTSASAAPCAHCGHSSHGHRHYSGRTGPNGVPAGRSFYNGHYYGNFNNRFYGPQYGYF